MKTGFPIVHPANVAGMRMEDAYDKLERAGYRRARPRRQDRLNEWRYVNGETEVLIEIGLNCKVVGLSISPRRRTVKACAPQRIHF